MGPKRDLGVLTCYPDGVNRDANYCSFSSSTQLFVVKKEAETQSGRNLDQVV